MIKLSIISDICCFVLLSSSAQDTNEREKAILRDGAPSSKNVKF